MSDSTDSSDAVPVSYSERGFAQMPTLTGSYGGTIRAYESSAADSPHVWVALNGETIHLSLGYAALLARHLEYLVKHHYQLIDRSREAPNV